MKTLLVCLIAALMLGCCPTPSNTAEKSAKTILPTRLVVVTQSIYWSGNRFAIMKDSLTGSEFIIADQSETVAICQIRKE